MKTELMSVVGNRPQLVKLAPIADALKMVGGVRNFIVHTGQHYDDNMRDIFFREMGIPQPDVQLEVANRTHGGMTGEMLAKLEKIMLEKKPSSVLIFGDTNSTLAAALAAAKLRIPLGHVEAGGRFYDKDMPEEINRVVADYCADLNFCTDIGSVQTLARENIVEGVYFTGDVMYDSFLKYSRLGKGSILKDLGIKPGEYVLLTCHRPSNTDTPEALQRLLKVLKDTPIQIVYPIHPRTLSAFEKFGMADELKCCKNTMLCAPQGYVEILDLINNARIIVTDSGGMQKEAYWAHKGALLILPRKFPSLLVTYGWQVDCCVQGKIDADKVLNLIYTFKPSGEHPDIFGDGHAAEKIVAILQKKGYFNS